MIRPLVGIIVVATLSVSGVHAEAARLRAGAARGNITPPLGSIPVGEWNPPPSTYIHDDTWVRCLALDDGKTRFALVVCDLLGISPRMGNEACRQVQEATGMPGSHLMLSATHTHSTANTIGDRSDLSITGALNEYQKFVVERVVDTVRNAFHNLEPAQIGWAIGDEPRHVGNRRWFISEEKRRPNPFGRKDDQVRSNPGDLAGTPHAIKPAGPVDPQLFLIGARRPDGTPIATFANYSMHYVAGKPADHISADYYGMYNERMKELLETDHQDPPFVSIMSNGTSGDIDSAHFMSGKPRLPHYQQMRIVAHDLADTAIKAYKSIQWQESARLGVLFEEIELKYRKPTLEDVQFAQQVMANKNPQKPPKDLMGQISEIYADRIL